ncbi:MAG: nitroreductase family deazaflavin-dependent oxidoreductase [Microthrixaceae bacterium]
MNDDASGSGNDTRSFNEKIIDEFRANDGRVGGPFEGAPVLLLHSTGARSGVERVNPMMYQALDGGAAAVFASNAGADSHPAWYHNVVANPDVSAEVGATTRHYRARVATPDERDPIWAKQKRDYPGFAEYEAATARVIPVVLLEPAPGRDPR